MTPLEGLALAAVRLLAHSLWQGLVLLLVYLICRRLLGRDRAVGRYRLAQGTLVLLAFLPGFTASLSSSQAGTNAAAGLPRAMAQSAGLADWTRLLDLRLTPALALILLAVWGAGAVVSLGFTAAGLIRLTRLVRRARETAPSPALVRLVSTIGLERIPRVVQTASVTTPFVAGWSEPTLVLPATVETTLQSEELELVLLHELAHVRRGDVRANLVIRLLGALAWHQVFWRWLCTDLHRQREDCCDEAALAAAARPVQLARALVALEERRSRTPSLVMAGTGGDLTRRIRRILDWAPSTESPRAPALGLLSSMLLVAVAGVAIVAAGSAESAAAFAARRLHARIQAHDPAGPFTVELIGDRLVGATIDGTPLTPEQVIQDGSTVRLLDAAGRTELTLQVRPGGIRWSARPPPSP